MSSRNAVIRCPIHGSIPLSTREIDIINSPFFQRLRHISQLGFTSYVFPGAVHTRFSHALGVMHLAGVIFDQILSDGDCSLDRYYSAEELSYFRRILRFTALLHDAGHLPFSHAAESLLPPLSALSLPPFLMDDAYRRATHEDYSYLIIEHLHAKEGLLSEEEAVDMISILSKHQNPSERMTGRSRHPLIYPLLCQIINGEIDADRMDYLLRDSYFAGVPYGKFDLDRLVSSFSCCLEERLDRFLLALDGEGVSAYEIFLLARIHMFDQIYFHKSLGAYRYYLLRAFAEGEIDWCIDGRLENLLFLTETTLMEEFKRKQTCKWSGKIFNRIPAKNLIRVSDGETARLQKLNSVKTLLQEAGVEVIVSRSANQYSSQLKKGEIDGDTVLVREKEFGAQRIVPLAEKSSLLGDETKTIGITQLYVHREDYKRVIRIIQQYSL